MTPPLPQLDKKQSKAFLLIYAAHVDYHYDEREEAFIKLNVSETHHQAMLTLHEALSDYDCLKVIATHKHLLESTPEEKKKMETLITQLFLVDGKYTRGEKVFLEFIDKLSKTM